MARPIGGGQANLPLIPLENTGRTKREGEGTKYLPLLGGDTEGVS